MPAVPGADQRQDRVGREVRSAKLRVRTAGPGAGVPDGLQRRAAAMGGRGGQPAGAWDHARAGAGALGRGSVRHAAGERPPAVSVQRRRTAQSGARRLRELASQPLLGAVAVCGQRGLGARARAEVEVHYGGERIAAASPAERRHQIITHRPHHEGIPLGGERSGGKILVQMRETAPSVEVRPLAAYESLAMGGAR